MKVPKAKKLPSGSWRVRVMVDGESVSITKATEREAVAAAMQIKAGKEDRRRYAPKTVTKAIDEYIESRKNVISPSTIKGYRMIQKHRFPSMMDRCISELTQAQWQKAVNSEAKVCSAKTLKNAWFFVSSVISETTGQKLVVRLPQVLPNELPFLNAEQIPVFIAAMKGHPHEIAALLALSSLRRSELLAVRWEDIDLEKGCIRVHGAVVRGEDGSLVYKKENKNLSSRRVVPFLIPQLREAVIAADKQSEFVVTCKPDVMLPAINKVCRENGLPEVGMHGLRRSFSSLAYKLGISEEVTMRAGGWKDITTMRKVYTEISEADIRDQGKVYESFFSAIE
jgi:integrase